jgi:hypothetical protein
MAESNPQLAAALQVLEQRLETPVVPGELVSWSEEAAAAVEAAGKLLRDHLDNHHPRQFQEILRQDKGLATRVEQLQQNDVELLQHLTEVRRIAGELRASSGRVEPDERLAADAHAALVEKGLQWVIAARTQEAAISTWYVEAFDRDRGDVD